MIEPQARRQEQSLATCESAFDEGTEDAAFDGNLLARHTGDVGTRAALLPEFHAGRCAGRCGHGNVFLHASVEPPAAACRGTEWARELARQVHEIGFDPLPDCRRPGM